MGSVPAVKRRKLTPPATDGEESAVSTLEAVPNSNSFFKQASSWNLEQDYETRPRKGKKKEKENTRLPIITSEGRVQQVEEPEENQEEPNDLEWLEAQQSGEEIVEEIQKPTIPVREQILEAKEE